MRMLRFRLRSFFILIALLGVVVYPIASEWQTVRREHAAVGNFRPYSVSYEPARSPIAQWAALPLSYVEPLAGQRIHSLTIARNWATGSAAAKDLRPLRHLQQLHHLEMNDGIAIKPLGPGQLINRSVQTLVVRHQGRSEDMDWLRGLPGVQSLAIRDAQLSSAAVKNIAQTQVRSLEISGYDLPPGGLAPLTKCKHLHTLRLHGMAAKAAPQLLAELPQLESLTVGADWRGADDQRLAPLHATRLKELTIRTDRLTDQDAQRIALQTDLRELRLVATKLSPQAVAHLRSLPELRLLSCHTAFFDGEVWQELGQFMQLEQLELRGAASAEQLQELRALQNLEQLDLHGGSLNDAGVKVLIGLPVKRLTLNYVTMPPQTRQRLEAGRGSEALAIIGQ